MRSRHWTAAAVLLGLGASAPAAAWTLSSWNWAYQSQPMADEFLINHTSFPASAGSNADVLAAMEDGMHRWGLTGDANFAFNYGGTTTRTSWGGGGLHIAQFHGGTVGGGTLATAQSSGFGDRMDECDIRFHAANGFGSINWSSDPSGAGFGEYDLEQTVTHEFGHCAGLGHSTNFNAVMYASTSTGTGPGARNLHPDDIGGLQAIYGPAVGVDMNLSVLDPLVAGTTVQFEVSGANAQDRIKLALSTVGIGNGPCFNILGGRCADILAPITLADSGRANNSGTAILEWDIPASYVGFDVGLQAVVIAGPGGADTLMSNPIGGPVLATAANCPSGESLDCDGNCWDSTWPGDGYCDDGTQYQWGDPNFNCALYNFDEGDCAP